MSKANVTKKERKPSRKEDFAKEIVLLEKFWRVMPYPKRRG